MITYQQESVRVLADEGAELIHNHNQETPEHTTDTRPDPDIAQYLALEAADVLFVLTVRDSGVLIGYNISIIMPSLHYQTMTYAVNDMLYLAPEYRGTKTGAGMIEITEAYLIARGVDMMVVNSKINTPLDTMLGKIGYTHTENVHIKYLSETN